MKIKVRLFARYRELVGNGETNLQLPPGTTVGAFKSQIDNHFPQLKNYSANLLVALNGEFADNSLILKEGDEIALLPPLSGG